MATAESPFLDDRMTRAFIDRYAPLYEGEDRFVEALHTRSESAVRLNRLKATPEERAEIAERLRERGALGDPVPWWPEAWISEERAAGTMPEHALGYYYMQDPVSMLPPIALDPQPGERVLDLCAAPGSKTTQIAELLEDRGILWANEMVARRSDMLIHNLQKWGVTSALVTRADGRRLRGMEGGFDRVLVDAPCSCLGGYNLLRGPIRRWSVNDCRGLAGLQRGLLRRGYELLKPGGTLVYSTCTLDPLENEGVASWLLEQTDAQGIPPGLDLAGAPIPEETDDGPVHTDVRKHALRLRRGDHPHVVEDFFIMRFTKPEAGRAPGPRGGSGPTRDVNFRPVEGEEEEEIRGWLDRDYGLTFPDLRLVRTKDRVFAARHEVPYETVRDRVRRIGVQLGKFEATGIRLTVDAAQRLAGDAKTVVDVTDEEAQAWLTGETLHLPGATGFIILRNGPLNLGAAWRTASGDVPNTLRKSRRVDEEAFEGAQ